MNSAEVKHVSVLLDEVVSFCPTHTPKPHIWDATLGAAGHAKALLEKCNQASLLGSDADERMLAIAKENLAAFQKDRIKFLHGFSSDLATEIEEQFDFIFLDLGISSYHLDAFDMGITYKKDQLLDMRLNQKQSLTASEWLLKASEHEISKVLFEFGEERKARKIARFIFEERRGREQLTSGDIKKICERAYARELQKNRHTFKHPYVKSLQAFRIFINDELGHLRRALEILPKKLKLNGRLAIISFHSLEDRMVKRAFKDLAFVPETSPIAKSNFRPGDFSILTKKPVVPSELEVSANSRSRSAKLRVLERVV